MSDWPASYGDTTAEYLAARGGEGLIRHRSAILWVDGADAVSYLQGIITQDVEQLVPGDVALSFLLEPRGKLTDVFWILKDEERVGLVTARDRVAATHEALNRWKIRVEADLFADQRAVSEVWGSRAADVVSATGLDVPSGWVDDGTTLVARLGLGTLPVILIAGDIDATGFVEVGHVAATAVRIEAGAPEMGVDVDEGTIPQESGLVADAVSFEKGCYLGQELVARIDTRGHVNRCLRGVELAESTIPPIGAVIVAEDREVGAVTSVAESLEIRAPVGMALIRREIDPGAEVTLRWDGGEARAFVRALPLTEF